jgi:hypothetical protein
MLSAFGIEGSVTAGDALCVREVVDVVGGVMGCDSSIPVSIEEVAG